MSKKVIGWKCYLTEILEREGMSGADFCRQVERVATLKEIKPPSRSTIRSHLTKPLWKDLSADVAILYPEALGVHFDDVWVPVIEGNG